MARLIDTGVFIDIERKGNALDVVERALPGEELALAAITASELLAGIHLSAPSPHRVRREAFVEGVLGTLRVVAFDLDVARVYAHLAAHLRQSGQLIGTHDLQIAATALAGGFGVVTTNPRDFGRVPGLGVHTLRL